MRPLVASVGCTSNRRARQGMARRTSALKMSIACTMASLGQFCLTAYPAGAHSELRVTCRNNSTLTQQRLSSRPTFHQNLDSRSLERGNVGSSWLKIGDGEEVCDASSNWSASGTAVHLGVGDEGRVAAGTNQPRSSRAEPVRKQVTMAV